MHSQEILALAREGNPQVLASIINHAMRSYGVQARVVRRDLCLHVLLEAPQVPEQESSVFFVQSLLRNLGVDTLETVQLYGHRTGDPGVTWQQQVEVRLEPSLEAFVNPFVLEPNAALIEASMASEEAVKPVMAELLPSPSPSPSEAQDLLKRPETVVLVLLLSLLTFWMLYLDLTDEPALSMTTGKLAQRLKVSRKILRRQKQGTDFSAWSRSRDPEGIAWQWQAGLGFTPCQIASGTV